MRRPDARRSLNDARPCRAIRFAAGYIPSVPTETACPTPRSSTRIRSAATSTIRPGSKRLPPRPRAAGLGCGRVCNRTSRRAFPAPRPGPRRR
jgi:hypothetical protein